MEKIESKNLFSFEHTIAKDLLTSSKYPYEILPQIKDFILKIGKTLPKDVFTETGENIWVAKSAKISPTAHICGPVIICEEAEIRHCAFIRGSAIIGKGAVVGNSCELKNCILFDKVQVPHFNYVGDSILGYASHLGAGAVTSNVKSDKKNVVLHMENNHIKTNLKKFGAILGDNVEVGCNSVLNPGTIIGKNTNIYPLSCVRGFVPSCSIYKNNNTVVTKHFN